jgi:hypothetical protein
MQMIRMILWTLGLLGATLGAFIDFALGRDGQEKVKDWQLRRWVEFDDLKLSNFGEKEAALWVRLSDFLFGAKLWHSHRLLACSGCVAVFVGYWFAQCYASYPGVSAAILHYPPIDMLSDVAMDTAFLAVSISLTRWISVGVIKRAGGRRLGVLPFIALLFLHGLLLLTWRPMVELLQGALHDTILHLLQVAVTGQYKLGYLMNVATESLGKEFTLHEYLKRAISFASPGHSFQEYRGRFTPNGSVFLVFVATRYSISSIAYLVRIIIAVGILLSFGFRRGIVPLVSLLWRRVIEDDKKGPFTLICGAIGAAAGVLIEVCRRF